MKKKYILTGSILIILLISLVILGIFAGTVFINPFDGSSMNNIIIWQLRLPRILLAGLIGAMLSVSGAILQSVLRNPLSDPYVLGISSGGGLGAVIALSLSLPVLLVSISAFIGAAGTVLIVYKLAKISGKVNPSTLILAGVAFSSFLGAILTLIVILGSSLQSVYFWMLGSFAGADWQADIIASICAFVGISFSIIISRKLNILSLGDDEAVSLGIDASRERLFALAVCSFMTGISVSFCGIIGFVGLIVPHIIRRMIGSDNLYLIPYSALFGACLMIASDILSRTLLIPNEIPIGILTAFLGAPFFLYLIRMENR